MKDRYFFEGSDSKRSGAYGDPGEDKFYDPLTNGLRSGSYEVNVENLKGSYDLSSNPIKSEDSSSSYKSRRKSLDGIFNKNQKVLSSRF